MQYLQLFCQVDSGTCRVVGDDLEMATGDRPVATSRPATLGGRGTSLYRPGPSGRTPQAEDLRRLPVRWVQEENLMEQAIGPGRISLVAQLAGDREKPAGLGLAVLLQVGVPEDGIFTSGGRGSQVAGQGGNEDPVLVRPPRGRQLTGDPCLLYQVQIVTAKGQLLKVLLKRPVRLGPCRGRDVGEDCCWKQKKREDQDSRQGPVGEAVARMGRS